MHVQAYFQTNNRHVFIYGIWSRKSDLKIESQDKKPEPNFYLSILVLLIQFINYAFLKCVQDESRTKVAFVLHTYRTLSKTNAL